jgi:hypothetical protein
VGQALDCRIKSGNDEKCLGHYTSRHYRTCSGNPVDTRWHKVAARRISEKEGIDLSGNSNKTMRKILFELNITLVVSPEVRSSEDTDIGSAAAASLSGNASAASADPLAADDDRDVA